MRIKHLSLGTVSYQVRIRDDADESVVNEIWKHHEYRAAQAIIKACQNPILDVGAHAGFFTLWAQALNKKVPIFSVEPEPGNRLALQNNLDDNKVTGVTIVPSALAKETGTRYLSLASDTHNHTLLVGGQTDGLKVNAVSLLDLCNSQVIDKIGFIKMDIEGGEWELFEAWAEPEFSKIFAIILEYHETATRKWEMLADRLRQNGFGVQHFPSKFEKTMGFLFAINKRQF